MRNNRVFQIVTYAMFIALVTATTFINFRLPLPGALGGLIHLGTLTTLIIAMKFGKRSGAIAGGIGMAIFDVLGGWFNYAPVTLVVRLIMGYVVGLIAQSPKGQGQSFKRNLLAWFVGMVIMIVGYYLYEAIFLYGFEASLINIVGNVLQFVIGLFALVIVPKALNNKVFEEASDRL